MSAKASGGSWTRLLLNATFVAGFFLWQRSPVAHGGAVASANGDTNGDGTIDLSDAVYLLAWLFRDGPAPVPCPGGLGLPATGQTTCYSSLGVEVECFSFCPLPCPLFGPNDAGRFVVNADDTVTDNCTGLQWQRFTADRNGDFETTEADAFTWRAAVDFCENLSFAGHGDWRLPNVRELQSIVDYGPSLPAADPRFRAEKDLYWSSTSSVGSPTSAWCVDFEIGTLVTEVKGGSRPRFVRAVRG